MIPQKLTTRGHFQRSQCPSIMSCRKPALHMEEELFPEAWDPLGLIMDLMYSVTKGEGPWRFYKTSARFQALRSIIPTEKRFQLMTRGHPALNRPVLGANFDPTLHNRFMKSKDIKSPPLMFRLRVITILQAQASSPIISVPCVNMDPWTGVRGSQLRCGGCCWDEGKHRMLHVYTVLCSSVVSWSWWFLQEERGSKMKKSSFKGSGRKLALQLVRHKSQRS